MKILVLGSTGLLGNAVTNYFSSIPRYEVTATYRTKVAASAENAIPFDALSQDVSVLPTDFQYVINCIGVIKPFIAQNKLNAIKINSVFPWELANWANTHGIRMIHITTDCVFSGARGKYRESDLHDALDDYGKSKSLGECPEHAMLLRTSIVGEEIHKQASLLAWAKSQRGKVVDGYSTHYWNGVTTGQYAKICYKIIHNDWFQKGLFHIHARDDVSKMQLLGYFNKKFDLGLRIQEKSPLLCDRTLRTEKDLCAKLNIPTVAEMIHHL